MESAFVIQLFLALGVIIAGAQLSGAAARAIGQPRVFGELLAGVVLGPTLLDMLGWSVFDDPEQLEHIIADLAELGVLFLMFTVGLEVHLRELLSVGKVAVWGGVIGGMLPLLIGIPTMMLFDYSAETGVFVGVALAATSVSISAQTLLELGILRTKEGIGLLAAAVVDDVLAILLLSIAIATLGSSAENASALDLAWILVRMMLYLGGALAIAWTVLPRLFNWLHHQRELARSVASFGLVAAMIFGWSADYLGGIAAITGAFIAGMGLSQTHESIREEIESAVQHISYAFLVPVFFVNVGLHIDLLSIGTDLIPLVLVLLVVAVVTKVAGAGFGARLGGFDNGHRLYTCFNYCIPFLFTGFIKRFP